MSECGLARPSHAPRCVTRTAGSDMTGTSSQLCHVKGFENMAEKTNSRKVLIAIDGSEHGDRAFDCKFGRTFRDFTERVPLILI